MANRRISEFPEINGNELNDLDLLTLVHVFEVDPLLRNKKITFTEFKNYLDNYYQSKTNFYRTISSSSAAGSPGTLAADNTYLYVCTQTNTWKRIQMQSF